MEREDGRDGRMKKGRKNPSKKPTRIQPFLAGTCRHQPNAGLVDFTFGAYNHSFCFRFACLPDRCAIPIYHGYHQTLPAVPSLNSSLVLCSLKTLRLLLILINWNMVGAAAQVGIMGYDRRLHGNCDRCTRNNVIKKRQSTAEAIRRNAI